jgi:lipopolysaccharide transport system permease protein
MAAVISARYMALAGRPFGPLRAGEWLWLMGCVVGALLIAAPRVLSQPVRYEASAQVALSTSRYAELFAGGPQDPDLAAVVLQSRESLAARYPGFGMPTLDARVIAGQPGQLTIVAAGRSAAEAALLADDAAETLARQARAAGGREILRNLMGWELVVALRGSPPATTFQARLRDLIRTSAVPLNRPIEPVSAQVRVDDLTTEERSDLARALEAREERLTRIELPATVAGSAERRRATAAALTVRQALAYLYRELDARFDPDAAGDARRSARASLPPGPVERHIAALLLLATGVGLVVGLAGIAVERSAGIVRKIGELWQYRELIQNLVLRDLRVRYRGSALGYLWTQLSPLLLMLVFWLVFAVFLPSNIAMYPVFLIVGLLPWNFCAEALVSGARSVIDNGPLVKKVFFPREVLPLTAVLSSLLNFILSLPMLFIVIAIVQALYPPLQQAGRITNLSWTVGYLPVLIALQTIFVAGVVFLLAALAVFFRDAVHLIGIMVQFWFFLTPVVYSLDAIGGTTAQVVRWLNPMASLIDFYREVLYGNVVSSGQVPSPAVPGLDSLARVFVTALAVLVAGYWFFQRRSAEFGERL